MTRERSTLVKTLFVTGVAVLFGLAAALALHRFLPPVLKLPEFLVFLIQVKLFVTTFNLVLLLALTGSYLSLYRDLPNKYTRSMLILSVALLLYALTANPYIPYFFGFNPKPGLGPFVFLSDGFIGVAIVILFYQSQT